jgi:hypothetical protein
MGEDIACFSETTYIRTYEYVHSNSVCMGISFSARQELGRSRDARWVFPSCIESVENTKHRQHRIDVDSRKFLISKQVLRIIPTSQPWKCSSSCSSSSRPAEARRRAGDIGMTMCVGSDFRSLFTCLSNSPRRGVNRTIIEALDGWLVYWWKVAGHTRSQ